MNAGTNGSPSSGNTSRRLASCHTTSATPTRMNASWASGSTAILKHQPNDDYSQGATRRSTPPYRAGIAQCKPSVPRRPYGAMSQCPRQEGETLLQATRVHPPAGRKVSENRIFCVDTALSQYRIAASCHCPALTHVSEDLGEH